jgi:choline transport protein
LLTSPQSYLCGLLNAYAWIATTAGIAIIVPQVVLAMAISYHPDYVPETWHYFLLFQAVNILVCLHNVFTLKKTMWVNDISCESSPPPSIPVPDLD